MPPADNNTPAPQQPKQGFFAKLFGKKPKDTQTPVLSGHESQTPPPQLDEAPGVVPTEVSSVPNGDSGQVASVPGVSVDTSSSPVSEGSVVSSTDPTPPSVGNISNVGTPSVTSSVDVAVSSSETPSSNPNQPV